MVRCRDGIVNTIRITIVRRCSKYDTHYNRDGITIIAHYNCHTVSFDHDAASASRRRVSVGVFHRLRQYFIAANVLITHRIAVNCCIACLSASGRQVSAGLSRAVSQFADDKVSALRRRDSDREGAPRPRDSDR